MMEKTHLQIHLLRTPLLYIPGTKSWATLLALMDLIWQPSGNGESIQSNSSFHLLVLTRQSYWCIKCKKNFFVCLNLFQCWSQATWNTGTRRSSSSKMGQKMNQLIIKDSNEVFLISAWGHSLQICLLSSTSNCFFWQGTPARPLFIEKTSRSCSSNFILAPYLALLI